MTCPFALDDGAYVLGALCPGERAEFERHLALCQLCRDSVAALAVLPGLLGRLDAVTAVKAADGRVTTTPRSILPRAIAAARQISRRRRRWYVAASVAALWLVVAVGLLVHRMDQTDPAQVQFTSMRPVPVMPTSPISAQIGLRGTEGGTEIHMTCRYVGDYAGHWPVRLVVFPALAGDAASGEQVGSWLTGEDEVVSLTALTHLEPHQIGRVELQADDHTPLLTWTPT